MDSQNTSSQSGKITSQGKQGYFIVAGIICLDLLMLLGGARWEIFFPTILISVAIIYLTISLGRLNHSLSKQDLSTDESEFDELNNSEQVFETIDEYQKSPTKGDLGDIRLLLVTGCTNDHSELRRHLKSWGVDFETADTSVRAFAKLFESAKTEKPFQTVLVDQGNLDMDDCQFAVALRADPMLQSLYLIHYGGSIIPPRVEQFHAAGYSRILQTPVDKTLLFNALHSAQETSVDHHNVVQMLDHYEVNKGQQPLDILIACSSNSECNKLRRILGGAGHQTFLITDGSQILDALENHHFDLAILEADIPEVSGIEAIKLYRFTHLNQPWIPFIVLLDSPNSQIIQACENADIDHLIAKPVSAQRLFETVTKAITQENHNNEVFGYPTNNGFTHYHNDELTLDTHQLDELKQLGKEKGFLLELVNQFDTESSELIDGLKQAVAEHDIESVRNFGHKLKDTAGNLGALNLYRLAVRTTRIKESDSSFDLENLVTDIGNCRISTVEALLHHLSQGNNSAYRKE